eukprot:TRINITY_DN2640_c0_g1_i2.p1 TRINITY_DN2640_c0_g1~~TRINITY_DN2640_c0_g1_i2.p1  ORF type:complete len:130 (+),score=30.26 TRINITY_DN2640_c0_g1_i2:39-392(+)
MSDNKKTGSTEEKMNKVRFVLASRDVDALNRVESHLIKNAKERRVGMLRGPIRMPIKNLSITTMKTPCGEGSTTWDKFQLRIHKHVIDMSAPMSLIRSLQKVDFEPSVRMNVLLQEE